MTYFSLNNFRDNEGHYPFMSGDKTNFTAFLLIVVVFIAGSFFAGTVLDPIARNQPIYICKDSRDFDGKIIKTNCGYEQKYGWPIVERSSFEENINNVSFENSRRTNFGLFGRNANETFVLVLVAVPFFLARHIYWSRRLEESKKLIR